MNTTQTKHMPAPWKLIITRWPNGKLSGRPYIYAPAGPDTHRHVCEPSLDDTASPEVQAMQEANAILMTAAPELLRACEAALAYLEANRPQGKVRDIFSELNEHENGAVKPLRAAIAKATQGQP